MDSDADLRALVDAGRSAEIEDRWMETLESSPGEIEFFTAALRALVRGGQEARATPLLQLAIDELAAREDTGTHLDFVKAALAVVPASPVLRPALFAALRHVYADCPSLDRLLTHFRLAEAGDPLGALRQLETWLRFDVGRSVLMPGRGLGRVVEIVPALSTLRVDFPGTPRLSLRLAEAERLLSPLAPGHFLLEKQERPAALQALAESDPGGLLAKLFASLPGPFALAALREHLSGLVPEDRWASWWKRAAADPRLAHSGGKRPLYGWSATGEAADDSLRAAFDAATARARLELARQHAGRSPELAAHVAQGVAAVARTALPDDPALALEALLVLEKLALPAVPGLAAAALLAAPDPVPVVAGVEDRGLRERALGLLRAQRADWPELYARLLRAETDNRTLGMLYEALQRDGPAALLGRTVDDVLARPHTAPRLFVWLCRELRRRPELDARGDWGLLRRLLDVHTQEAFRSLRAPLRELFDAGALGAHLAERLTLEQAELLHDLLLRDLGLEEHRKETLRATVLRRFPELRATEEEVLYTTAEALERKRAEFEQITRHDIPRNAEEIRKAAAHGDLRENFEYKAARDRHEMLSSRAKTLHEELRRARRLDPASIDPSRVRVGTHVVLVPEGGGASRELTILGPWDSDPAAGIVSYLAPAVQPLLGKTLGDAVPFLDDQVVVRAIRVWRQV